MGDIPANPPDSGVDDQLDDGFGLPHASGDAPAERQCMACGASFLSEGWHNRLCRRCAKRGEPPATSSARAGSRTGRRQSD